MTANVTAVDIGNMALDLLTEGEIGSFDEDNRAARILNRWFDTTRESELLKNTWHFAIKFPDDIPAVDSGNDGAFRYVYDIPAEVLRPLWMTRDGTSHGVPLNWSRWWDGIRTDFEGPLKLPYIANIADPNDWDALFTEVVAAALALRLAHAITGKSNMVQIAQGAYDRAVSEANRINAGQRMGRVADHLWTIQRGDNRHWRA